MLMATLGILICGNTTPPYPESHGAADKTLDHLSKSIDRFADKSINYLNDDNFSEDAQSFGAFCARVVLENACAALVGRLDPFRLLYLAEFQSQQGFTYGRHSKSGFRWANDVLAEEKNNNGMWNTDHDVSKISRALFSQYTDHIYWKPSAEKALDFITKNKLLLSDFQELEPETFTKFVKSKCSTLYSTLSKGVHWEFFSDSIVMDEETVKNALRDCLIIMGMLGLISHFVPTAYRCLKHENALKVYQKFRNSFK